MDHTYWHRQTVSSPLYPDILWSKPEQRSQAGRIGIIGGNKLGFAGVAAAYTICMEQGSGYARVLLPDALQRTIPPSISDTVFATSNPSGGLAKLAEPDMLALGSWASITLLVGDAGRNSETAIAYESFLRNHQGPVVITRDAIDLVRNDAMSLVERPNTLLVASFAQLQKIFQSVYYPKMLVFSMQLTQLVEALHKFTITYPVCIVVLHKDHIVIANQGTVTSTPWSSPMAIWRGETAARIASTWAWHLSDPLQSATASLLSDN